MAVDKTGKDDKDKIGRIRARVRVSVRSTAGGEISSSWTVKASNVVWSTYERPKDTTPGEMSKTAERVVKRLKDDLSDKKPGNKLGHG